MLGCIIICVQECEGMMLTGSSKRKRLAEELQEFDAIMMHIQGLIQGYQLLLVLQEREIRHVPVL